MAKAKMKQRKIINQQQKGEGKGFGPSKRDADYEHAGVAIAIHKV